MIDLPINPPQKTPQRGFSLIELTIVLIVVALLSGGLMLSLSSQQAQVQTSEAQGQQELATEALLGFAMSNGRLPCPADPGIATGSGAGDEAIVCSPSDCSTGEKICSREYGTLPWRTLALKETDPWGNRFTYFVGREFANPLSLNELSNGQRARFSIDTKGRANIEDGAGHVIAGEIPAVIVSHGKRAEGAYQPSGTQVAGAIGNEAENADADLTFIFHTPTESAADKFDDLVTWIIPTVLKSRMVAVGKLP